MTARAPLATEIRNMLKDSDLRFADFVEMALYHPQLGYYAGVRNPVGKEADFVTSPALSPVFGYALARLISEFSGRIGDGTSSLVDIGCGDGRLLNTLYGATPPADRERLRFLGVDRSLERLAEEVKGNRALTFVQSLDEVPPADHQLFLANELFDALPFARLVQRDEHLHELWVTERDGELDWTEHEAPGSYEDYFAERGIELAPGQFADVSLEWVHQYDELCRFVRRGLIITFDYGYPERQLFDARARRFGTAAAYSQQRVTRDLLRDPGEHDITAHINFSDLIRAGERAGLQTLFFDRQAKFLLALGATGHELFTPVTDLALSSPQQAVDLLQQREDARRLILPDGIGEDIRVLVQSKGLDTTGWSFQRKLF
jgi:SAM-dependent MidA family methyltransferase